MLDRFVSNANELAVEIEEFAAHFASSNHAALDPDDAYEGLNRLTAALLALEGVRRDLRQRLDQPS